MTPIVQPRGGSLKGSAVIVPSLEAGDFLDREEFMRRYEARSDIKKAELINNLVFMASPAREEHSQPEMLFGYLLSTYGMETPHVHARSNMTVNLSAGSVVQPDWYLRIEPVAGGRAAVGPDKFLNTAPELVVEVAVTSASYDLHPKKDAYELAGALEYIVWESLDFRLSCFILKDNRFVRVEADSDGVYRCRTFPGLWIDVAAFGNGDKAGVKACLLKGLASPDYQAFIAELKKRAEGKG